MFYRARRDLKLRAFDRAIAGILDTPPLILKDAPWCIVSMVANRDVPMYILALKSFYARLGRGKVAAIVDRGMPQTLRDTLSRHLVGIEFVTLEEISTEPCQRGGTWERLLYCLDRSATEYAIQIDADVLTVGENVDEVLHCLERNQAFTISDGFSRATLPEVAKIAQATPSTYIGVTSEAAFDRYPGASDLHYIRGSSGFAGFAKGGMTRAFISDFHREMEQLVGKVRWREWGSEQVGSNFAIANSPGPLILPYPDYASFTLRVLRHEAKLFHFIGRFRFVEGYFARRSQEVIAALTPEAAQVLRPEPVVMSAQPPDSLPLLFARNLTPESFVRYVPWRVGGRARPITVQMRPRSEFCDRPAPGPRFQIRPRGANSDGGVAYEIFIHLFMFPPVWIPPERVELIVDVGANVGMSCLWWLSNYWRAHVIAFEPHPGHAAQARINLALNDYEGRFEFHEAAAGPAATRATLSDDGACSTLTDQPNAIGVEVVDLFAALEGRRVDILKLDIEGSEVALLEDPRFEALNVGAIVMEWHTPDSQGRGGRDWCVGRLQALGYRTYITSDDGPFGMVWGYRNSAAGLASN